MTLVLRESDVRELLPMLDAIDALERAFIALAASAAQNRPRQRVRLANGVLHVMRAGLPADGVIGLKAYSAFRTGTRFLVSLYSSETGELLALIEADLLGRIRTGAASGLATKYLARRDARRAVVFGAGRQARTQLEAVAAVRGLEMVTVYGRDQDKAIAYSREMSDRLGIPVQVGRDSAGDVRRADVVITMTNSATPVLHGAWLAPGVHVNAAGSNVENRRELDGEAVARADVVAVDSIEQCQIEAGDLILAIQEGAFDWGRARELSEIVAGKQPGREAAEQVTLFESLGLAVEDIAVAKVVYDRARAAGRGTELSLFDHLVGR